LTNFVLNRLKRHDDVERRWPGYFFGGHIRTSTAVLILAFAALWFVYNDHRESTRSTPTQVPASEVVPPGFVPDPNYTWVPRTQVQETPTTVTVTPTPTPTPTPTTTTPPFGLPPIVLPPPFGPPATTTPPGQAPTPAPAPAPPPPPLIPGLPG
jgi:hypothetical protein